MKYICDNSILCNNLKPRYEIWEDASNEKLMQYVLFGWYFTPDLIQCGASSESYDPTVRSSVGRCQSRSTALLKTRNYEKYGLHSIEKSIRLLTQESTLATSE